MFPSNPWLTLRDVASHFKVAVQTARMWSYRGRVLFPPGVYDPRERKYRWRRKTIEQWHLKRMSYLRNRPAKKTWVVMGGVGK